MRHIVYVLFQAYAFILDSAAPRPCAQQHLPSPLKPPLPPSLLPSFLPLLPLPEPAPRKNDVGSQSTDKQIVEHLGQVDVGVQRDRMFRSFDPGHDCAQTLKRKVVFLYIAVDLG